MNTKVCTRCGNEKDISEFHKDSQKKDGLGSQCKICKTRFYIKKGKRRSKFSSEKERQNSLKESRKKCYQKQKKNRSESHKIWANKNKEALRIYQKTWRDSNLEKARASGRADYYKNKKPKFETEEGRAFLIKKSKRFRDKLCIAYLAQVLRIKTKELKEYPPLLIEAERARIQLYRTIKEKVNHT
jgi:CRISPR/Cas system CSM-associated protein Csm4 (group 5 of RAMP superfamily)